MTEISIISKAFRDEKKLKKKTLIAIESRRLIPNAEQLSNLIDSTALFFHVIFFSRGPTCRAEIIRKSAGGTRSTRDNACLETSSVLLTLLLITSAMIVTVNYIFRDSSNVDANRRITTTIIFIARRDTARRWRASILFLVVQSARRLD